MQSKNTNRAQAQYQMRRLPAFARSAPSANIAPQPTQAPATQARKRPREESVPAREPPTPRSPAEGGSSEFPSQCPWCIAPLQNVASCAQHVRGKKHRKNVVAALSSEPHGKRAKLDLAPSDACKFETVEDMWADACALQLHVDAGFDVDLLQDEAAIEARCDSLRAMSLLQEPDVEWVKMEKRIVVTWNGQPERGPGSMLPLTTAPPVAQIRKRLFYDAPPPKVRIPSGGYPMQLPVAKERQLRLMWPNEPNSRLPFAALEHLDIPITDVHIISNTAFVYACTGDTSYTKETFYLQWYQGTTLCVLYVPKSKVWSLDTAGHRVEQLITEEPPLVVRAGNQRRSHHAISILNIGDHRICVTSEIDAHDSANINNAATNLVEIKSSRKGVQSMLGVHGCTQMACNGSQKALCCHIDQGNQRVTRIESLTRTEVFGRWEDGFVYAGQRARTALDIIMNADDVLNAMLDNSVIKMTFDEGKAPVFEQAYGVTVVPKDLV